MVWRPHTDLFLPSTFWVALLGDLALRINSYYKLDHTRLRDTPLIMRHRWHTLKCYA